MPDLDRTLLLAGAAAAIGTLIPVALHQSGALDHLPDPPLDVFQSDRITESRTAHPLGIPDSYLGLASYGTTLALALTAPRSKLACKLLGPKLTLDAAAATFNVLRQPLVFQGKMCSWCTATALATAVMAYAGRRSVKKTLAELGEVATVVVDHV